MITESLLRSYAALAVRQGVNVQKGQLLVIRAQEQRAVCPSVRGGSLSCQRGRSHRSVAG